MRTKPIIWICILIFFTSQAYALTTDSWDNTLYSFNKTQDGALVDDCDSINYDVWNASAMDDFSAAGYCKIVGSGGDGSYLFSNLNHTFNLAYGIFVRANNVTVSGISGDGADHYFQMSNESAWYGQVKDKYHQGFGFHSWATTTRGDGTWTGLNSFTWAITQQYLNYNATINQVNYDWNNTKRTYSGDYSLNTDAMFFRFSTPSAQDGMNMQFNAIRAYPYPITTLVNFTVLSSGSGVPNYNITFYNTSTQSVIHSVLTDANGLAQLNLSKGANSNVFYYPVNITVVISYDGSVVENDTVVAEAVKGIYPGDVFVYNTIAAAPLYNSITLDSPVNDTHNNTFHQNYCYTPIFNSTIVACQLYTNETGNFVSEEIDASITNNSLNCFSHTIANDGFFIWNVYCNAAMTKWGDYNFTHIIDTNDPDLIVYSPEDNTYYTNSDTISVSTLCSDEYVYQLEYQLLNSTGGNITSAINETDGNTTLRLIRDISLAGIESQNLTFNVSCSDSHTSKDWNPLLSISYITDGILLDIDSKDKLEFKIKNVEGGSLEKISTIKVKDRLLFNLTFTDTITSFEYEIKADSIKRYKSEYYSHLILNERYWWDSNPYRSVITDIKAGKATVLVSGLNTKSILTESIGGLNINNTAYTLVVDNDAPEFVNSINQTNPVVNSHIRLSSVITELYPGNYTIAWNYTGSFVNSTIGSYSNGETVTRDYIVNDTGYYCFYVWANDLVGNQNTSGNTCFTVTNYNIESTTYGNYTHYMTLNWTRVLNFTMNYTCSNSTPINVSVYIDGIANSTSNLTCNSGKQKYSGTYKHSEDDNFTISMGIYDGSSYTFYYNSTFMSDITNPTVIVNFTYTEGFTDQLANITLQCNDSALGYLIYNLTFNNNTLYLANYAAGQNITNRTIFSHGINNITGQCIDLFGKTAKSIARYVYFSKLYLIDEKTKINFTVSNCSSAKLYYNNVSYYDLKSNNTDKINFTGSSNTQLRLELIYERDGVINTYVDTSLLPSEVRLCANKDDTTRYPQYIYAAYERQALLENTYAECYVAADYTRFAYENSQLLKAFTIDAQYNLYTYDSGNLISLGGIDGSVSSNINLDTLVFNQNAYDFSILQEALSFQKVQDADEVTILYRNQNDDITSAELNIYNLDDDDLVYTLNTFTDPNSFSTTFSWATLTNISNATVFKAILTKQTDAGTEESLTRYFGINGNAGIFNNRVAIGLGVLLLIFGLSFAIARVTFSWFGIFIELAALFAFTSGTGGWVINFLIAIDFIIIVYTFIQITHINYPTVT